MEDHVKGSLGTKPVENKLLQNFTIPKIKRNGDKFCLLHCTPSMREFGDILDTLNNGRLNLASELKSLWAFSEIKLVINDHLTKKFFEKRNEMKELGRLGRELEDRFCFLVVPLQNAMDIAENGLSVGSTTKELGNPKRGVYLFRYIDVALNFAHKKNLNSHVVLIFKVLFGKVKTVKPNSKLKSVFDPTPNFDSHISRKVPLWNDPFDEQVTSSLIYVYEYDSSLKPVKAPRQCLPIAAVDGTFIININKTLTASVPVRFPSKPVSSGNTTLANCTVVKRIGKGKDAKVIFKSVTPSLPQAAGIEIAPTNASDKEAPSIPVIETEQSCGIFEKSPLCQNNITLPDLTISLQQHSVALENLITSCMVITSKSMKDPRLLKRSDGEIVKPVGEQNQYSLLFENEVSCNTERLSSKENACYVDDSINKTQKFLSFEERRLHDSFVMSKEPFVKGLNKYSSFLTHNGKEKDSGIESLANIYSEEKADHSIIYDQLCGARSNQLGTENSLETEFAVSMSLSTLNCSIETTENAGKDNRYGKETEKESGIDSLPNISFEKKPELPKKLCSNNKLYKISASHLETARSELAHVFDFMSFDYTKETSENGGKATESNRCLTKKNRDPARTLFLSLNEKERDAGVESLINTSCKENLELSKKLCRKGELYRVCASHLGTEESQQTPLSDVLSLDYSKESNEKAGKSENYVQQSLKNEDAAIFKEKHQKIKSFPNTSREEKAGLSRKLCRYDKFWKIHSNQVKTEKNRKTQVSEFISHKTSNCSKEMGENGGKSEISQCMSKKAQPQDRATFLSCQRKEKDKEVETLPNTPSLQVQVVDCLSLNTPNNIKQNEGKSEGPSCISRHTILKKKATLRKTRLIDYYNEHCLQSKEHSLKDSYSMAIKTKLLKKSKDCFTGGKRRSCGSDKDKIYKAAPPPHHEKVKQDKESQVRTVQNHYKVPAEINTALNDKMPTSIDDTLSPLKLVSTAVYPEKVKHQKAKEKCTLKKTPEKERFELYVPKGVAEKAEEFKRSTATPDETFGLDTEFTDEKDSLILHSLNKINSKTSSREESFNPMQSSPVVRSPTKASIPSTELDEFVKDVCIDQPIQVPHSKKMRNQPLAFPKNTCEDATGEEVCFVTESLENRIDWNGIFGMDLEKVNASLGTLKNNSLRQEKEPSGLRIFPDMEITITNNYYLCADDYSNNIVGEMQPSMEAKETISKSLQDLNGVPQDHHSTDAIPGIQFTRSSVLQGSENFLKDNLDLLSIKMDSSGQSNEKVLGYSQDTSNTVVDSNLNSVNTLQKLDLPTPKKRLNKKRIPSVLVKRSTRRIHKFSQSEENIKVVLGMLSDEIPLCKNKRISKKLDRAILHLRKAHKRVKKSLQLAAKVGERQNLSKTCSVQGNPSVNGEEEHAIQVESTSSQILQTEDPSLNRKATEIQKSPTEDRQFLIESTQGMINGPFVHDAQKNKVNGSSGTKISLLPPCKVPICTTETPEDHSSISSVIVSDKENTVPMVPSLKSPDGKTKHVVNCEMTSKESIVHSVGQKRKHASKRMFSQVRKRSSTFTISAPKSSNRKLHAVKEKTHLKVKRNKGSIPTTDAKTSSLLLKKLSDILQKASKTESLKSLYNCKLMCQKMIPAFVKAFEKKQHCALEDVIVDRRLFVKENLKTCFRCTLKPQAVEAFLELQMVMETRQFVENRMHYIEGRPTFRSLLWYDGSLYTELLTGKSGYQQQSHFYSAFQEKLKLNSVSTLENHYAQLFEYLQAIQEKDSCYYVYLKYNRELQECEDVLKNDCDHAIFSLSVPFSCGVHIGDTIDDLTALQKSTLEIIRTFLNLPKCDLGKKEHALSLLEFISAKIDYIKTCVSTSMQRSLFGLEHLLFDAAKVLAFNERKKYGGQIKNITKEFMSQINSVALSKLYDVYCVHCEQPNTKKSILSKILNPHKSSEFFDNQDVFIFGKIIDQARCAEPDLLKKMIQECSQHLEFQSKYFQILQECIVDEVIIQETNVLDMAQRKDAYATLLKPEAVEAYIDLAMTFETLHFLNCLLASKNNQMRTRGLLWYDTSLFSDLIQNQYRVESLLKGNAMSSAISIIDSTILDIKSELEIISNCSNSVNYTYAFQIITRELSELSELRTYMKSNPAITTYINVSPFVASLHYGNSLPELDHNYKLLSDYLEILLSTPKKDLGKVAHTMKIMNTIDFIKALVFKTGISTFDCITWNVLHNRKKHGQSLKRQIQDKREFLNGQSPWKRICFQVSADNSTSSTPKKQKGLISPEKASSMEREENEVKPDIKPRKLFEIFTPVPQYKNQNPVKNECVKDSPQKESKLCFLPSLKHRKEYTITASEVRRADGKDCKTSPSNQDGVKMGDYFVGTFQEALTTTDMCEFTLDSADQPLPDSKSVDTCCPESLFSVGSGSENANKASDIQSRKVRDEFSEEKESSLDDNASILSMCSMDINTSEEQENIKQLNPGPEEQEEIKKDLNVSEMKEPKDESTTWNGQSVSAASRQYPPFPNSWQYSLYCWYQNGDNTGGVRQTYPQVSYSTQPRSPFNQSSAFSVPNSYITNQPYSSLSGQIQARMYSAAGPFGASVPYNYTDPSTSSNQNPVPIPYSYNSINARWPCGSWQ
ncbi:testis-expressed protein 15 [Bufo gargarizans]|uniref:testis-expressed protein 15 n=1 Tax=Bufo gargarizans TaxID=30331 RepID=UPI001CF2892A|nr:testis-expressed protein 15 [Bufo gargarizans]